VCIDCKVIAWKVQYFLHIVILNVNIYGVTWRESQTRVEGVEFKGLNRGEQMGGLLN